MSSVQSTARAAAKRQIGRALILSIVSVFLPINPACGQDDHQSKKEDNLYWMALTASVKEMEKQWGGIDVAGDGRIRIDYRNMLVRRSPEITDGLPTVSGSNRFTFLSDGGLLGRFKSQQKDYAVLEVHPIRNEGQRLRVEVSLSWVSGEKGKLTLGISDWSDVDFAFDCTKHIYVISSLKLGGI